jgi:hypothetical protein
LERQGGSTTRHAAQGADLNFKRRWWYWLLLVPLIVSAALALLRYAGWAAIYSGNYGLPSQAWRLGEASNKANVYCRLLMGFAGAATFVAIILIPPLTSEKLPPGIRGIGRFVLAFALVIASILMAAIGIGAAGHYLR